MNLSTHAEASASTSSSPPSIWIRALTLLAGPAALGLALSFGGEVSRGAGFAEGLLRLPMSFAIVALLMLPALYIGGTLLGVVDDFRSLLGGTHRGLESGSMICLGVAPAVAFLSASASTTITVLAQCVGLFAGFIALRSMYVTLFRDTLKSGAAFILFLCWSAVAFAIGAHLFVSGL